MYKLKDGTLVLCKTCRWWQKTTTPEDSKSFGICRINPPVVMPSVDGGQTTSPLTLDQDWCGKWKKKQ